MTEIVIGIGAFLAGSFIGATLGMIGIVKAMVDVNKFYKEETGNDFVQYIRDFDVKEHLDKNED